MELLTYNQINIKKAMKTLKNCPELMTVIINIQTMREKINPLYYDKIKDFKALEKMSEDTLHALQDSLIPDYNKTFNSQII